MEDYLLKHYEQITNTENKLLTYLINMDYYKQNPIMLNDFIERIEKQKHYLINVLINIFVLGLRI